MHCRAPARAPEGRRAKATGCTERRSPRREQGTRSPSAAPSSPPRRSHSTRDQPSTSAGVTFASAHDATRTRLSIAAWSAGRIQMAKRSSPTSRASSDVAPVRRVAHGAGRRLGRRARRPLPRYASRAAPCTLRQRHVLAEKLTERRAGDRVGLRVGSSSSSTLGRASSVRATRSRCFMPDE